MRAFNFQDYKIRATKGLQKNLSFLKYNTFNKSIFHISCPVWNHPAKVHDYKLEKNTLTRDIKTQIFTHQPITFYISTAKDVLNGKSF